MPCICISQPNWCYRAIHQCSLEFSKLTDIILGFLGLVFSSAFVLPFFHFMSFLYEGALWEVVSRRLVSKVYSEAITVGRRFFFFFLG